MCFSPSCVAVVQKVMKAVRCVSVLFVILATSVWASVSDTERKVGIEHMFEQFRWKLRGLGYAAPSAISAWVPPKPEPGSREYVEVEVLKHEADFIRTMEKKFDEEKNAVDAVRAPWSLSRVVLGESPLATRASVIADVQRETDRSLASLSAPAVGEDRVVEFQRLNREAAESRIRYLKDLYASRDRRDLKNPIKRMLWS